MSKLQKRTRRYIVWVGGIDDLETDNRQEAEAVRQHWLNLGYDDCCIEVAENDTEIKVTIIK